MLKFGRSLHFRHWLPMAAWEKFVLGENNIGTVIVTNRQVPIFIWYKNNNGTNHLPLTMLQTFTWQHCQWHCLQKIFCLKLPNWVRNKEKIGGNAIGNVANQKSTTLPRSDDLGQYHLTMLRNENAWCFVKVVIFVIFMMHLYLLGPKIGSFNWTQCLVHMQCVCPCLYVHFNT